MQQITTRLGPALIGVGFGLETLARGGDAAEAGLRTALRAIASFAAFFGPTGFIVAGIAAATAAVIDIFQTAADESKKATKKMGDDLASLVDAADFIGLQKALRDVQEGIITFDEKTGKVARSGGLASMVAELDKLKQTAGSDLQRTLVKVFTFGIGGLQERIIPATKRIAELEKLIPLAKAKQKAFTDALLNPPEAQRQIKGLPPIQITGKIGAAEITELANKVQVIQEAFARANDKTIQSAQAQQQAIAKAIPLYDQIKNLAKQHAGEVSDANNDLQRMLRSLTDINDVMVALARRSFGGILAQAEKGITIPRATITDIKVEKPKAPVKIDITGEFDPTNLGDSIRRAIKKVSASQAILDALLLGGASRQKVADATENLNIETVNLQRTFTAAADAIKQSSEKDNVKAERLKTLAAAANVLGIEVAGLTKHVRDLDTTFSDIAGAARGIGAIASEIGGANDEMVQLIESTARFADSLAALSQLKLTGKGSIFDSIGGLLKSIPVIGDAIASVINLGRTAVGAITGSEAKKQNDAILEENNRQLERLRQDLAGFNNSIGQLTGASRVIQESAILNARLGTSGAGRGFRDVEPLDRELRAAGSSLAELKRRAEQFGITITDAAGRISAQGLADLNEALKLAAKAAANFENDIASLRTIQNARRDIFELDNPAQAFNDAVAEITKGAPELASKFLSGIDVSTAEGRRAAEQALRDLFDFITKSGIDLTPFLKGFDSVEDFINSMLDADHALDNFADTAKDATNEMVNVVKGFKDFNLERARFAATANLATTTSAGGVPFIPRPNPTPIPVGSTATTVNTGSTVVNYNVRIDGTDKDAATLATELVTELRRKAKASANPKVRETVNLLPS